MFSGWQGKKVVRGSRNAPLHETKNNENYKIFIDRDGEAPPILSQLVRYLQTKGSVENIFKITPPPGKELQTLLKKIYAEREALLLSSYTKNPHVVAELTKHYLSSLPEPLLSFDFYDRLMLIATIKNYADKLKQLKEILLSLPHGYHSTSNLMLGLLSMISNSERTNMPASELAPIFVKWFIRPSYNIFYREEDSAEDIMIYLIYEYEYLFKNTRLKGKPENVSPFSGLQAPPMLRQPSIRYQDISQMNQNRKPIYYLQQVKDNQEKQQTTLTVNGSPVPPETENKSISDENTEENEPSTSLKLTVDAEPEEEEEEEEEEFNEEESRKTDEMMGVIDDTGEPLDEVVEETSLELEEIASASATDLLKPDSAGDVVSNSIVLMPSLSPRTNSTPMIYDIEKQGSEGHNISEDFEFVDTETEEQIINIDINETKFEDVTVENSAIEQATRALE